MVSTKYEALSACVLSFWWCYNEHFYMQSHVHKRVHFNSYKLQNGKIGDYSGLGYPVVDYLMALHLHNLMAATQLEERRLVCFTFTAAVKAVCRRSRLCELLLNFPVLLFFVFPDLHSIFVFCDLRDESNTVRLLHPPYIHLQVLQAHP